MRIIWAAVLLGSFWAFSNVSAEVKDVKVGLELNQECIVVVKYTNSSDAALKGRLTLNVNAGVGNRKGIKDHAIDLAPGATETIGTQLRVSGEAWVFVQTSFSGVGTGTAIMVPADKTLVCPK